MIYETYTINLLHKLGIHKMYKGCTYILTAIGFITENEDSYSPITKILYVEIAKAHNTSNLCVERNIRSVIEYIWRDHANDLLLEAIFGSQYLNQRPSNMTFLSLLYKYIQDTFPKSDDLNQLDFDFSCPLSGMKCEFCNDFIHNFIQRYQDINFKE